MTSRDAGLIPLSEPWVCAKPACGKSLLHHDPLGETASFRLLKRKIAREIPFHDQEYCLLLVALQRDDSHLDKSLVQVPDWANLNAMLLLLVQNKNDYKEIYSFPVWPWAEVSSLSSVVIWERVILRKGFCWWMAFLETTWVEVIITV